MLTVPLLEKIVDSIKEALIVIADCSGKNPNVFYELGIAHALGKEVILITKDPVADFPSDVRLFEFITYKLDDHVGFLNRLDNALNNIFFERYEWLYERAEAILKEFGRATKSGVVQASKDLFLARVRAVESTQDLPARDDRRALEKFLLPRIIADSTDAAIMAEITNWIARPTRRSKG